MMNLMKEQFNVCNVRKAAINVQFVLRKKYRKNAE